MRAAPPEDRPRTCPERVRTHGTHEARRQKHRLHDLIWSIIRDVLDYVPIMYNWPCVVHLTHACPCPGSLAFGPGGTTTYTDKSTCGALVIRHVDGTAWADDERHAPAHRLNQSSMHEICERPQIHVSLSFSEKEAARHCSCTEA